LRAGAVGPAAWVVGQLASPASDDVVAVGDCGSAGGAGGVDFGCHFLRSGVGTIDSVGDMGGSGEIDGVDGAICGMRGAVGL
jgi:hypothetical protein